MPSTINGVGTTYYGKKNVNKEWGHCEHCNAERELTSYDTGHYVVVVFIPIIPIGKKRIIDECSVCRQHRAMPLKEWEGFKESTLVEGMKALEDKPDDIEVAMNLHGAYLYFQKREEAAQVFEFMKGKFTEDPKVQLYLGSTLEEAGKNEEAGTYYKRAYDLDPELPSAKLAYGQELIRTQKLDEAHELLRYLEQPIAGDSAVALCPLAVAYQEANRHVEALTLLKLLLNRIPSFAEDDVFQGYVRRSETALGREDSILPKRAIKLNPFIIWSGVAILILASFFGINHYLSQNRTLYVLNGFSKAISVDVGGQGAITVQPGGLMEIAIAEGSHNCQVSGAIKKQIPFAIRGGFFDRFTGDVAFVLNPGGAQVVMWEEVTYREVVNPNEESRYRLHYGLDFQTFDNIDYVFEPFPETIDLENRRAEDRTRISPMKGDRTNIVWSLFENNRKAQALKMAKWHLKLHPHDEEMLSAFTFLANVQGDLGRAVKFLKEGLKVRPLPVQWHRTYQGFVRSGEGEGQGKTSTQREALLVKQYDAMLQGEPENSKLLYLRGRLVGKRSEALRYFRSAIALDPKNAFAHNAIAYALASSGKWKAAKASVATAHELAPTRGFDELLFQTRIALKENKEVARELFKLRKEQPLNDVVAVRWWNVLSASGKESEALKDFERYQSAYRKEYKNEGDDFLDQLKMQVLYFGSKFKTLEKYARGVGRKLKAPSIFLVYALVEQGKVAEAAKIFPLDSKDILDPYHYLIMGLAWNEAGQPAKRDAWYGRACELLAEGSVGYQVAARLIQARTVDHEALSELDLSFQEVQIVTAVLAKKGGRHDETLAAKALLLNAEHRYPYHFMKRTLSNK